MSQYFWIALGNGLGGMARFALPASWRIATGRAFPWSTLVINAGSFGIGFFPTWTEAEGRFIGGDIVRQFMMIGLLGGFMIYSPFSLLAFAPVRDRAWFRIGANATGLLVLCFSAVGLGHGDPLSPRASHPSAKGN